jgi:murein DD-endopeptidase MepM/ murein hydrolase activator NlpD
MIVRAALAYLAIPLLLSIPLVLIVLFTSPSAMGCVPTATGSVGSASIPPEYADLVNSASTTYGVSAPRLAALLQTESGWNPTAVSPAGARGLGQLMPATAARLGVTDPFDPAQSINGAAQYLSEQYATFGDWDLAAAAYNAGPGAVQRYGGIPPFAETQNYVRKVGALAESFGADSDAVLVCLSDVVAGPVINGDVACPIGQPHSFTDTWGASRSGGRTHKGVDIFAEIGVPLYAYTDGTVRLTSSGLGGLSMWIDAPSGDRFYYAHLSRHGEGVSSGMQVRVGDLVGYNGNTGNARFTPPHLHWQVHPGGGAPVNPTAYARAACG